MINVVSAIFFVIISFVTWLAISFKLSSYFIDEEILFKDQKRAIMFYIFNMLIALVITAICYALVCVMQKNF